MRFCLIAAPTPNAAATMTWRLDDTSTTVQDALSAAAECPVEGGGTACVLYLDIQSPDATAACTSTSPALAAASAPTTDLSPLAGATGAAASSSRDRARPPASGGGRGGAAIKAPARQSSFGAFRKADSGAAAQQSGASGDTLGAVRVIWLCASRMRCWR